MRELSFNIEAARRYGVDGAVLLQGMAAWISKNRANERHFHDGRWWTYNSQDALVKLFPFWSRRQIQRIVKALNTEGALLLGNYSDGSFHNTTWYALSDEVLELLGAGECAAALSSGADGETERRIATGGGAALAMTEGGEGPAAAGLTSPALRATSPEGEAVAGESTAPNGAVLESTAPNGAEYRTERGGTQDNLPKESKSKQVNTNNPPCSPPEEGVSMLSEFSRLCEVWYHHDRSLPAADRDATFTEFLKARQTTNFAPLREALEGWVAAFGPARLPLWKVLERETWREDPWFWLFWQMYPRKIDKERARRAWRRLKPDPALAREILASLRRWKLCDQWQEERFIPHPATWLNGKRWEAAPPGGRTGTPEPPEREVEEWT